MLRNSISNDFWSRLNILHIKVGSKCETLPGFDDSGIRGAESEDKGRLWTGQTKKTQVDDKKAFLKTVESESKVGINLFWRFQTVLLTDNDRLWL